MILGFPLEEQSTSLVRRLSLGIPSRLRELRDKPEPFDVVQVYQL